MPLTSQKMKTDVVGQIRDRIWMAIVQRSLRPGARLKEEELAEVFQVSRARIRQALAVLEKDGLVTLIPNRGPVSRSRRSRRRGMRSLPGPRSKRG